MLIDRCFPLMSYLLLISIFLHCTEKLPPEPRTDTSEIRIRVNWPKGSGLLVSPWENSRTKGYLAFGDEGLLIESRSKWHRVRTDKGEGWLRDTHTCMIPKKSEDWYQPFPDNAQKLFSVHPAFLIETAVYEMKKYAKSVKYTPDIICEFDFATFQVHALFAKDCYKIPHRIVIFVFKRFEATKHQPYAAIGLVEAGLIWKAISVERHTYNPVEGVISLIPASNGAELNPECPSGI